MARWAILLPLGMLSLGPAFGQDPDLILHHSSGVVGTGGQVEVNITLDNQEGEIQGWSWGVCSDPGLVSVQEVEPSEFMQTVKDGDPPDFQVITIFPDGWNVGMVISAYGCCAIPLGDDYLLYTSTYEAGPGGGTTDVSFCGTLGKPPVGIALVIGGASVLPVTENGTIEVVEADPFARGDCNQDGALDLADVIFSEIYMFAGGATPGCIDACDNNDDGVLNIADPIYLLNTLFIQGPPLPSPAGFCGLDPTDDDLVCESCDAGVCP